MWELGKACCSVPFQTFYILWYKKHLVSFTVRVGFNRQLITIVNSVSNVVNIMSSSTRTSSASSLSENLVEFIGKPTRFSDKNLPTIKDVIKQALFLRETFYIENEKSNIHYHIKDMMADVYPLIVNV